ncbi:vibriobactin-specific 2,3-dihydroxybenzoate-AMP ligase [Vibrio nigripulchritudo]|uniref:(2,3-dihydroxybenzoyl)adenylate synthase n=1 Tax=Vibrio nigripulchritudo TaxID=28173 RepID=UPI00190DCBFB|nr:(2,3-dihydroxybenzoyl)adenylate synthase [Vibrio nigripulchritudo]BCL72243.1 vibriobactin-specific 2,3-dihydroxybenzoate-AMP ligase [Vibrio nigripulchritudo]BDU33602.1 vibriobactin-specific 2,3-dihydroxybenzoate-AMP ligase [Vibrio nigripulchritudo]
MSSNKHLDFTSWPEPLVTQYNELGYWENKTLFDHFLHSVSQFSENVALVCGERQFTYQDLAEKVSKLASGFLSLGLEKGDNVVLQMTNVAEFYLCYFALLQKGIRPVLALPAHRFSEVSYFCAHAEAKAYIIDGEHSGFDYQELARKVLNEDNALTHVLVRGESSNIKDERFTALDEIEGQPDHVQTADASDLAFFQLSGGTTGTPKLIPRTHNDYAYSVIGSNAICEFDVGTRYLCALPVAHNFPLSSPGALGVFFAGGTVVLTQDPTPKSAFRLIEDHNVTVSGLVPPLALLWMDQAQSTHHDISSLELVQVGGAKFSETAARELPTKLGCQLQQVFGMAEGLVNYTRLDDPIEVIASTQGRPISKHDQVKVVDEDGNLVPTGEEGFLLTQGPYTIRGYYRAEEHNRRSFNQEGFYSTGDIVKLTEEGNIIVTGRDKDQINRGGEKIAAEEVENQLLRHDGVHDAALVAVPDDYLGERSCAVIVKAEGFEVNPIKLKYFLRDCGLADYKIPDLIKFVDSLPKTSVGKINKKKLREEYAQA